VRGLDFANPASLETINAWVKAGTNEKIPTIIDEIPPDAVMYLINAMYFKGSWRDRFDPAQTRDDQFTTAAGTPVPVSMMHHEGGVAYYADAELEAVDLPYGNSAFTMTVLLPREGRSAEDLAAALTPDRWNAVTSGMNGAEGDVYLPRFRVTFKQLLNDQLQALGMRAAFGDADFTPMSPRGRELFVSKVLQKTFVDVNEEGTEAAAATAVEVTVTSAPTRVTFRADRPFLFAIRERFSGTILFVGKLVEPAQS
jgi:serine protease inhibitor